MKNNLPVGFMIMGLIFITLVIIFVPFIFIWAVNTLFMTSIEYTLMNWFASIVLIGILNASTTRTK